MNRIQIGLFALLVGFLSSCGVATKSVAKDGPQYIDLPSSDAEIGLSFVTYNGQFIGCSAASLKPDQPVSLMVTAQGDGVIAMRAVNYKLSPADNVGDIDIVIGRDRHSKTYIVSGGLVNFDLSQSEIAALDKTATSLNGVAVNGVVYRTLHALIAQCLANHM